MDYGVHVNGIEWPVVPMRGARLRVTMMPQHTKEHLDAFVTIFEKSLNQATETIQKYHEEK